MKKIISNLLIFLIIIFLLNICYSKLILKDNLIRVFGKSFVIVTTGSMEPEIKAGELVIISNMKEYKKQDIITYEDDEGFLITHRITNINENTFTAKGDANNITDEEILTNNIKGKVIYHSAILGFLVLYILKPLVFIYIILFVVINIYHNIRAKNECSKNKIINEKEKEECINEKK